MITVISPAKSLDFETQSVVSEYTIPDYLEYSEKLMHKLRKQSPNKLSALMSISANLGKLNWERNQNWSLPFTPENAKQASLAFNGDVYLGLDASSFSKEDFEFAQDHLRILSGLYGMLRPLDLIQPYRLEMGTKFSVGRRKDLYHFWRDIITKDLNTLLAKEEVLLNLASNEYFGAVDSKRIKGKIITPQFKELKNGEYKMISFFAKKARGLMSAYMIKNKIEEIEQMKGFDYEGYMYSEQLSDDTNWLFIRG